jgi:hypothetical protein
MGGVPVDGSEDLSSRFRELDLGPPARSVHEVDSEWVQIFSF